MPHKWMAPVGNLAHLWNFTVSKYWLKLRVCRQKSPLLLSCWKRTWLHFQSHPSSAQMEIDEELRSWEIVPSSLNRIEIPGAFEVEHHDKLTRMTYYAFLGFKTRTKGTSEYRVFRGDHHEWSHNKCLSFQIWNNLFAAKKIIEFPPQVCRITQELQRSK